MTKPVVKFVKKHPDAQIPSYSTEGAAGMDLSICERVTIQPRSRLRVTTGLNIKIPNGYMGFVQPRSGLAAKQGITVLNTPGLIDEDYTGELGVILYNTTDEPITFMCPDRIAQLVILPAIQADTLEVETLEKTVRGESGFGSTGL